MGAHDFKNYKVPLFGPKTGKINTTMSAAPKPALVPASRYYCDVNWSYHNVYTDPNTTSHNRIIRIPLAFVRK